MRLPSTPRVAWHSRGENDVFDLSANSVEESHVGSSGYTRVEAPVSKGRVNVLPAVVHLSYSVAILVSQSVSALGVSGANCGDVNGVQGCAAVVRCAYHRPVCLVTSGKHEASDNWWIERGTRPITEQVVQSRPEVYV